MAFRCEICDKGPRAGKSISHSHKASIRRFLPNVQKTKVVINGTVRSIKVCTSCLRSDRVAKAGPRQYVAA
jgi:large subunit ribosomal protein L28